MTMEHYFSESPSSEKYLKTITVFVNGTKYKFVTASGVFSKDRVDRGTLLLVSSIHINKDDNVLDLGCGYGVMGIVFANYAKKVFMTDINERAVELARSNAKLNGLKNVVVAKGDLYGNLKGMEFDKIVCNPPIRAGRAVINQIISEATSYLKKGGFLYIVARTSQGAKTKAKKMKETFGNQAYITKRGGYRVIVSKKE